MARTRFPRLLRAAMVVWAVAVCWAACSPGSGDVASGESHFGQTQSFLRVCEQGVCEQGDSCSCAVCTVACNTKADCAERILGPGANAEDLPDSVTCRAPACGVDDEGTTADSVCDVVCQSDEDCAFLDDSHDEMAHECRGGFCRTRAEPVDPSEASEIGDPCPAGSSLVPGTKAPDGVGLCLDRTEVTVADYRSCVEAGDCLPPEAGNYLTTQREQHPVNFVSPDQAEGYCQSVGSRLPTPAEWQAASGDGPYPWGEVPPASGEDPDRVCALDVGGTCETGSAQAGAGPWGHVDLVGNVAEIVTDDSVNACVAGGSFSSSVDELSPTGCPSFDAPQETVGFRCLSEL